MGPFTRLQLEGHLVRCWGLPFAGESAVASEPRQGVGLGFLQDTSSEARGLFLFQMMEVIHHTHDSHDAKDMFFHFWMRGVFSGFLKHSNEKWVWFARMYFLAKDICMIYPIGSMYGIFSYIYHKNQPNVGNTIHGSYGYSLFSSQPYPETRNLTFFLL